MALRGTLTHWKTRMLAQELGMMPCQALGVLEALWHTTAELAPSGNIGRLPNQAIAMEMFYEGDADVLIEALVKSRHLESHPDHRLIVHDWLQHSDHNTKRKVERRGGSMIANDGSPQVMTRHKSIPVPVPVPEPVPEPVKKEQKTSRDKREVDSRHVIFKGEIERYAVAKGVLFVWDVAEAKQLDLLLKAAPQLKFEEFKRCLVNRARSPGTPHGDRPRVWLPNILKYQEAPLNEFGKTGAGNGTFKGKTGHSVDAATRAIEAIEDRRAADRDGDSQTSEVGHRGLPAVCERPGEVRTGGPGGGDKTHFLEASR